MSMPFSFGPADPEQIAELKKARELHEATVDSFYHSMTRLIGEELDEEQLITLKTMLQILANQSSVAGEWHGWTLWALYSRFGLCPHCGVDHDKEAEEALQSDDPAQPTLWDTPATDAVEDLTEAVKKFTEADIPPEARERNPDGTLHFKPAEQAAMIEYHLDDAYSEDGNQLPRFIGFACTGIEGTKEGCGMMYPSIEDRMLKEPENCPGCFERMKHG